VDSFGRPRWGYSRCHACGLLANNPFPSIEEIVRHYEERSANGNYDVDILTGFDRDRSQVYRDAFTILARHRPGRFRGEKVLDIGCCTGTSLEVIHENGGIPFGVELQEEAARVAADRFPGRVYAADICQTLPFGDRFAALTMTDVLEHLHDPPAALRSLSGALEDDGLLLLTTPNTDSPVATLLRRHWPSFCPIHHIYLFNPKNAAMLLERLGFIVLDTQPLAKRYPVEYLRWVIPKLSPTLGKLFQLIPKLLDQLVRPMRGGEMLIIARKNRAAFEASGAVPATSNGGLARRGCNPS
jgi:2-polyprenyl-3-methyl-5-hydroxy-6-metoxy-1,4-benzoquinol methylase